MYLPLICLSSTIYMLTQFGFKISSSEKNFALKITRKYIKCEAYNMITNLTKDLLIFSHMVCQSPDIPRQNVFLSSETSVIRCFQIKNALSEITPTPIFVCFEQTALLVVTEYKFKLFLRI